MADEPAVKPGEFEKPAGVGPLSGDEPVIHVMPERFYGAPAKFKAKEIPVSPSPTAPPVVVPKPEKPIKKFPVALVIVIALVLLVAVGVGAYFLFFARRPAADVCGDGVCAASESYATCPEDCPEPGPVCGDGKCERPETYASCPQDCEPPTVCGDGICEEGEDYRSCPGDCETPTPECGDGVCDEDLGETYKDCPEDCAPPEPKQSSDADSDGLTDAEEQLIYGSDPNNPDTDGDGFVDLNEVLNLYDPARPDPALLIDNPGIVSYGNATLGIDLYRPKSWAVREIIAERTVHFTATTGEVVKVSVFERKAGQSLVEWYLEQPLDGMSGGQVERGVNKKGYDQLISADRRSIYVSDGTTVISFRYDLAGQLEIRYRVTLTMMANSLTITGKPAAAIPAEPVDSGPALPVSRDTEADEGEAEEMPSEEPPIEEPLPEEPEERPTE